jgi:hypothetical protein
MTELNQAIINIPIPDRMKELPISDRGFPVPFFVAWIDGKPDFRAIASGRIQKCVKEKLCWLCGQKIASQLSTFVIGPMCVVNRAISEPPSHRSCAEYAAKACPFLNNPAARRNEKALPEGRTNPPGKPILRNPGVVCIWTCKEYKMFPAQNGVLFNIGEPTRVQWYAHGRLATRKEVEDSISSGMPILIKMASEEGHKALLDLLQAVEGAKPFFPLEEATTQQ